MLCLLLCVVCCFYFVVQMMMVRLIVFLVVLILVCVLLGCVFLQEEFQVLFDIFFVVIELNQSNVFDDEFVFVVEDFIFGGDDEIVVVFEFESQVFDFISYDISDLELDV